MEKRKMTQEQYEAAKDAVMAVYLQEKQSIAEEFNGKLAVVEDGYRKAQCEYREEGKRLHDEAAETKNRYESDLTELKVWLLAEEQKAVVDGRGIDELRLLYKNRRAALTEERNRRLDANDRLTAIGKIAYAKAVQNWKIGVRDLSARREACEIAAYRFMLRNMSELQKPDAADEGGEI